MQLLINLGSTFLLGLLTPLTAVCVLPLYPGFLSFLSRKLSTTGRRGSPLALGGLVAGGVVRFLVNYKAVINRVAGVLMLGVSLYYLIFVFRIFQRVLS